MKAEAVGLFDIPLQAPQGGLIRRRARFSPDKKRRFLLTRIWDTHLPVLPFVLLNPSTADGEEEDATSRKGIGFAWRLGFGGMVFANLYDMCATHPNELRDAGWPRGDDDYILRAASMGLGMVICGWGANARGQERPAFVLRLLREHGYKPHALQLTADGIPCHPLMLPYHLTPFPI